MEDTKKVVKHQRVWTNAEDVDLVNAWNNGIDVREIASMFGVQNYLITSRIRAFIKLGVTIEKRPRGRRTGTTKVDVAGLNALLASKK
jgi:transposase